jgi:hypothetical protein
MNCCRNTAIACEKGHIECLKTLHFKGYGWSYFTIPSAAENGHLDCLKYACEAGCEWNHCTTYVAAIHGHLECLKYMHKQDGCEKDKYTTYWSAKNNHLECLLYCLENVFPIHTETLNELNEKQIDKNLLTNIKLRKILLHPRIKNDITNKYPKFIKAIKEYEEFIKKVYTLAESNTNLPTDVIKYEIIKYI